MDFILRRHPGRLPTFTVRSHQECGVAEGIHKQSVSSGRNVKRYRRMAFPGICHRIGVHLDIASSSSLVESLQLQSKAVDIFLRLHRKGDRNAPLCLFPVNLLFTDCALPAYRDLFYLFCSDPELSEILRCKFFRFSQHELPDPFCYLLHFISSCARHNAPMIPGFSPNAGATMYCDRSSGRLTLGRYPFKNSRAFFLTISKIFS